ncbi:hypothetical protein JKP88DRAFT_240916 [Tribonema minus]|uniref:Uncharacterized protein n=1 Tax=Tribonema minus TaxID=303371 RepID=A0A835Z553_9STRA|nr:hypothetical protein JKP88DRAFT_240916 [Tribonema minus]
MARTRSGSPFKRSTPNAATSDPPKKKIKAIAPKKQKAPGKKSEQIEPQPPTLRKARSRTSVASEIPASPKPRRRSATPKAVPKSDSPKPSRRIASVKGSSPNNKKSKKAKSPTKSHSRLPAGKMDVAEAIERASLTQMTLKDIKVASVATLRQELALLGQKTIGPREVLEAQLMFHLPLDEIQKIDTPDISGAIQEMKSVSIANMAEGTIYAVLIGSTDAELRTFIRSLDSTYKSSKRETSVELVERAGLVFSNNVHDACDNDMLKDADVLSVLRSTAAALGLKPPSDSKKACAFFQSELNSIEKLVVIAKSSSTKKGFWQKLGATVSNSVKGVFHGLWTMTKFIASTMKDLASKAWPLLLKGGALIGTAALACKAAPEHCLDLFNSVYEFICPRVKWLPGQTQLCSLINYARCSLLLGAAKHVGKLVGGYAGNAASLAVATPVLQTTGGTMLTTAYSMATAWIIPAAIGLMIMSASIWMYSGHAGSAVSEFLASQKYSCTMDTSVTGKLYQCTSHSVRCRCVLDVIVEIEVSGSHICTVNLPFFNAIQINANDAAPAIAPHASVFEKAFLPGHNARSSACGIRC